MSGLSFPDLYASVVERWHALVNHLPHLVPQTLPPAEFYSAQKPPREQTHAHWASEHRNNVSGAGKSRSAG